MTAKDIILYKKRYLVLKILQIIIKMLNVNLRCLNNRVYLCMLLS